jgi:hypothetical protein
VNARKVTKGQEVQLFSGDVIKVVFRRDDNKNNVVYRFEDLTDDEQLLETQEYNEEDDDDDSTITITDDKPPTEDSTDNPAASDHTDEYEPPHKVARPSDSKDMPAISKEPSVMEQSLLCGICQVTGQTASHCIN